MKIPQNLPQFEKYPVLFTASGEYEAKFYVAHKGNLELKKTIKMPPREEAREKQGFITSSSGPAGFGAVGHHGRYVEDLKKKFAKKFHAAIHDLNAAHNINEMYFFAPRYVVDRAVEKLDKAEQKKIRMKFYKEYTKISPLEMVKTFWKEAQSAIASKIQLKSEEKKILKKPRMKLG